MSVLYLCDFFNKYIFAKAAFRDLTTKPETFYLFKLKKLR